VGHCHTAAHSFLSARWRFRAVHHERFYDLVLGQHGSATEQGLALYNFDGRKYQRTACYDASWSFLGNNGEYHTRKEPYLTPAVCDVRRTVDDPPPVSVKSGVSPY
jgi:hypothetical protein